MKLSQIKNILGSLEEVNFTLPDGSVVPVHYHVTEVGQITKNFIDCGGTVRQEKKVNFQLWEANDTDHRLAAQKLLKIISLSEKALNIEDTEVEVEYQTTTIGKYGVGFNGKNFELLSLNTACLASDSCGSGAKQKVALTELGNEKNVCCAPGGGCC